MTPFDPARHAPVEVILQYALQGAPGALSVDGSPSVEIAVSPVNRQLSLSTPVFGSEVPDLSRLANLDHDLEDRDGTMWHRLHVRYDENLAEVYPVLCAIADRMQIDGQGFAVAVEEVLEGLGARRRGCASP